MLLMCSSAPQTHECSQLRQNPRVCTTTNRNEMDGINEKARGGWNKCRRTTKFRISHRGRRNARETSMFTPRPPHSSRVCSHRPHSSRMHIITRTNKHDLACLQRGLRNLHAREQCILASFHRLTFKRTRESSINHVRECTRRHINIQKMHSTCGGDGDDVIIPGAL